METVIDSYTYGRDACIPYLRSRVVRTERGASLVEYALLVSLIAIVCVLAISFVGKQASTKFSHVGSSLS
jgi:pilus assembly protein Flp/PilA